MVDFPVKKIPYGQQLDLRLKNGSCPKLKGRLIKTSNFYEKAKLGDFFQAELKIKAGKINFYSNLPKNAEKIQEKRGKLLNLRLFLSQKIKNLYPKNYAWVEAFLIGNKTELNFEAKNALKRSGTAHIVAISGLHLAIFSGLFYFLASQIVLKTNLRFHIEPHSAGLFFSLIFSFFALLLSGSQIPTLRAWIMIFCLFSGWIFKNSLPSFWALWLSLIPVMLLEPDCFFKAGFWLSYLATATIILSFPVIKDKNIFAQFFYLQIFIFLTLLAPIWAYFGGFSLSSLFINLLIIPVLPYLLMLLLFSLFLPFLLPLTNYFLELFLNPIFISSQWESFYLEPKFQPSIFSGILLSLAFLAWLKNFKKLSLISLIFATVFSIFLLFNKKDIFFNTKEKMAIIFYQNKTIIFNTGYRLKERNEAERYLLPYLKKRALKPDFLILTKDSIWTTGGILPLKKQYPDLKIWTLEPKTELAFDFEYCPKNQFFKKDKWNCKLNEELEKKIKPLILKKSSK